LGRSATEKKNTEVLRRLNTCENNLIECTMLFVPCMSLKLLSTSSSDTMRMKQLNILTPYLRGKCDINKFSVEGAAQ
jgi:hypothetical protein